MRKKTGIIFCTLLLSIFLISFASAANVAYIYKNKAKIDKNVLNVFSELGLSVEQVYESNLPKNFSKYKLIFIGDERFNNFNKIPVGNYPTIVSNYYYGDEWGFTDIDGISKLASTSPLEVIKDENIIQVYTKARYSIGGISIPYYFLDDNNKASGMQKIAETWIGTPATGESSKVGDVISYANEETKLLNGKTTKGKICFFGIVESDYWTPDAKKLFKDCINFVSVSCYKDSDCGDDETSDKYCKGKDIYEDVTSYSCINPGKITSKCISDIDSEFVKACTDACSNGECKEIKCRKDADCNDNNEYTEDICIKPETPESYCSYKNIKCLKNSDCGIDNWLNNELCKEKDVFDYYLSFKCNNPGSENSYCTNSTSELFKKTCSNSCLNGECIECTSDIECNSDHYTGKYCKDNKVYNNLTDYSCKEHKCVSEKKPELIEQCSDTCVNGECKEVKCKSNSECGTNSFTGNKYCKTGNVYEDFLSYSCNAPGTMNSYCSNNTKEVLKEYCDFECLNGECITCFSDISCGKNGFLGDKYCTGKNIYQDYKEFSCSNPGTSSSTCNSNVFPKLIEECSEACLNGECRDIECYKDSDCDDGKSLSVDECNNPGTPSSYCSNTPVNCANDNDCGITGFFGEEFCSGDNIFKKYKDSKCINPGTKLSYCDVNAEDKFLKECGEDSCGQWENTCKENNVYKKRTCQDRKCENGACSSSSFTEESLIENCEFGCENGECTGECSINKDCGDDYYSDKYCKNDDVYYLFNDFFCTCHNECAQNVSENLFRDCGSDEYSENYCKNDDIYKDFYDKGCNNGNCIQDVIPELIKDCGDDSCSSWEKHCYEDDVYEERTCYDKGCSEGSCSSELTTEKLKVENCLFGCEDGACTDECSKDSDCSDDYYSDKYCKNDDVYYKFHNFFCKTGSCNEDTAETLFQDCGNDYCEDWSENYCRGDDIYQKKTCYEKGCKDENCYSNSYEEEKLIEKCPGTCEYGECKEECYDSKWKCLDSGYDSGTKLSSYVISFSGKAGHEASLNSLCGKSGAYYIYNSTGVIKIKTPELPEEGNYLFSFKYETGTKDQNYEKFRVECGTKKYDFPDVYKDNEKYREISIACDFKEGVNYIKFISTGKDSAHFEEFKISNCNMHDSCEGADFSISVNMSVVGEKCHSSNKINDSKIINIPSAGEYSVLGLVSRGNPGQCQTNEDFRLIIKKELGPETHDDADACAISSRYEYLGDFDFLKGDNELLMRTVAICPPDNSPNSVRVNEFCLFKNLDD